MKPKKRARPILTVTPDTKVFHDRAAIGVLRRFPDRRWGVRDALETLTDVEWDFDLLDDDRRKYTPVEAGVWHPIMLEPVQIEIANTDPEGFVGILCALLQGWWPTDEERDMIQAAQAMLRQTTLLDWTHNYVQGPQAGTVFASPAPDSRTLFLSVEQIQRSIGDVQWLVSLLTEKLQGEHPTVWDKGLYPPEPEGDDFLAPTGILPETAALLERGYTDRLEAAHGLEVIELRKQIDIAKADTLFTKDEGEHLTRNPGARMERGGLVLAAVNEFGRTQTEQELTEFAEQQTAKLAKAVTPHGLVVDDENGILNWEGENFVKQTLLQEYQMAARQVHEEQAAANAELGKEIERLKTAYADLLQQREVIDPIAENTYERDRAEAVELVEAILAGAGFELLRDGTDRSGAMWQQKLDIRPGVQVFLTVPEGVLAAGPANVYAYVKANVGVAQ